MPRGKYPRRPAAMDSAPPVQALSQPAPAQEQPSAPRAAAAIPASSAVPAVNARRPHRFADHAKSRDLDRMPVADLRVYGREIGMSLRDCAELSEQRLRAGCRAHLERHFDALME